MSKKSFEKETEKLKQALSWSLNSKLWQQNVQFFTMYYRLFNLLSNKQQERFLRELDIVTNYKIHRIIRIDRARCQISNKQIVMN